MFNRWVDSATLFKFLEIKGLRLVVSEGLCHGKREWQIQIVNIPVFSTGPSLAEPLSTDFLEGSELHVPK